MCTTVKKTASLLLAVLMLLSFAACAAEDIREQEKNDKSPPIPGDQNPPTSFEDTPKHITPFAQYLDAEGFVPGMTQTVFREKMEGYLYNGTPITEIALGHHFDDENGGGYSASDDLFGFSSKYSVNNEEQVSVSTNRFHTSTSLGGLSLPHGITFADTLASAFEKMGLAVNPKENFAADDGSDVKMTLKNEGNSCLYFMNMNMTKAPVDYETPYRIYYTETYTIPDENGENALVERSISLWFPSKGLTDKETLDYVSVSVRVTKPIA